MVGCDEGKNCYMPICLDVMKIELLSAYMLGCDEDRTAMVLVFICHDLSFHLPWFLFSFAIFVFICLYALLLLFWYAYVSSSSLYFHMPNWCTFAYAYLTHVFYAFVPFFPLVLWQMMNTMLAMIKWPRFICSFRLVLFSVWYRFVLFLLYRHFWAPLTVTDLWLIWTMIWGPYLYPFCLWCITTEACSSATWLCWFNCLYHRHVWDEEQGILVLRPSLFFIWQCLFVLPCRLLKLLQGRLCSYSQFCYHPKIGEPFSLFYMSLRMKKG
jgi:hypothetical protein